MEREREKAVQVLWTDRKELDAVRPELNGNELIERAREGELSQADLDRNLQALATLKRRVFSRSSMAVRALVLRRSSPARNQRSACVSRSRFTARNP
jgi:hypothetical protein